MRALAWLSVLAIIVIGCGGGGGGGGGNVGTQSLSGRVLSIETGAGVSPSGTVRAGTASSTTDPVDGFFQLDAPTGSRALTVTYAPPSGSALVRTFEFPALAAPTDLGDLYIGPLQVTVEGRTTDSASGLPLAGASLTLGGRRATSQANGTFRLTQVAFANSGLAVFLGLLGQASAEGYFVRSWSPGSGPVGGVARAGDLALTPLGSEDPPPPPFNIEGTVRPIGAGANARVQLKQGSDVIRTTVADGNGQYTMWVPVGNYTLVATKGSQVAMRSVVVSDLTRVQRIDVTFP